jgi:hypothetical protein
MNPKKKSWRDPAGGRRRRLLDRSLDSSCSSVDDLPLLFWVALLLLLLELKVVKGKLSSFLDLPFVRFG